MSRLPTAALCAAFGAALGLAACSGGSGVGDDSGCAGFCQATAQSLSAAEVEQVIAQGVAEAQARGAAGTIAVVDRVGNVLAVFRMAGADTDVTIDSGRGVTGGLEQIDIIPDTLAAIAKAITGAYLSSEGNAFTTRTASQIVQENFNPGEFNQPGGPLFGVQFSQLPCSDLNLRYNGGAPDAGPKRSPLGLSADPGGIGLYKNGVPVGGVGVIADGVYGLDLVVTDRDQDLDEYIALAAVQNFAPPIDRRGDRITVDGKSFRFVDAFESELVGGPATTLAAGDGDLQAVTGYSTASIQAGTAFPSAASGFAAAPAPFAALDGFELVDETGTPRFRPIAGTDSAALGTDTLTATEVETLLLEALRVANRARGQIRRPLGSQARVTISVVDTNGAILGIIRTRDAPIFGTDVSLQKARTAMFFSSAGAADDLLNTPDTTYLANSEVRSIADYVPRVRSFLDNSTALADGAVAFADRSGGNLSRPFFPDGLLGSNPGPLSKPFADWSPFSVGLQLDMANSAILQHVVFTLGGGPDVDAGRCTQMPDNAATGLPRMQNGIQIFPGSVPIYRGRTLVGGIGVSGDGIDQDDMISFLGLHNAGLALNGAINNAPADMRADNIVVQDVRLRYVQCPQAPFLNTDEQNVCQGK